MAQLNLHLLAQPAVERAQALSQRLNLDQGFMKLGFGGDQVGVGHGAEESAKMGPVSRKAALEVGDSLDARLVLLALHAGVIQAQVVERYQIEAG